MSVPPAPPVPEPQAHPGPRPGPKIGPSERLSATLALSLITFGVLILGVGFVQDEAAPVVPTLDVILTQTRTDAPPKDADFIAQANNQGGGDSQTAQRPREPQAAVVPKPQPGVAPRVMTAQAPPPALDPRKRVMTTTGPSDFTVSRPEDQPDSDPNRLPTGRELMQRSVEAARLASEIAMQEDLRAKRPKKKFITASTQQYEYASYMRAWVEKVERVGNLNYPAEARRNRVAGRLVMDVAVRPDGSVADVVVTEPSGQKVLDLAAVRIVRLSEPFPPLPKTSEQVDELHITRTWDFKDGTVDSN